MEAVQAVQVALAITSVLARNPTEAMLDALADRPEQVRKIKADLQSARMERDVEEKIRAGRMS